VPVLTLDVNEDFKDKHESLVEKVGLKKDKYVSCLVQDNPIDL
jgi:hypothetical protein